MATVSQENTGLSNTQRRRLGDGAAWVVLTLLGILWMVPFLWMVSTSLKPLQEVESSNPLPTHAQPENYAKVFQQISFARYYFNSVFVSAWVTFLTCFTSAMAGYAFSRLRWPGRDTVFKLYLATMMIPGVVMIIPNFTLMVKLHLLDSYSGLIIPASFSAFGTFLMRQFMLTIHPALDESAADPTVSRDCISFRCPATPAPHRRTRRPRRAPDRAAVRHRRGTPWSRSVC